MSAAQPRPRHLSLNQTASALPAALSAALSLALALAATTRPAQASTIPCTPVDGGAIFIDGILGDWQGVDGVGVQEARQLVKGRESWSGPEDLSFELYCNHDQQNLYLAVNVKDEYLVRSRKPKGDDHLVFHFQGRTLEVYPGDLRKIKGIVRWGRRGQAKGLEMAEAMQEGGYSVELRIPLKQVPGFRPGLLAIPFAAWVADADSKARMAIDTVLGTAPSARQGKLVFAQAQLDLEAFLSDKGYRQRDIRLHQTVDVVGGERLEQVLLVGRTIGVLGEDLPGGAYFYLDLPVQAVKDVYWLKLLDLNGDGKQELVVRTIERSGNGRRELLSVFRFNSRDQFVRAFAHEILKGQGPRLIVNRFAFAPRRRHKGIDLVFDKPQAKGFSAESFQETPSSDCFSILLPWGETKARRFRFEGDEYFQP